MNVKISLGVLSAPGGGEDDRHCDLVVDGAVGETLGRGGLRISLLA